MPRRLLRNGRIVEDEWRYSTELETAAPGTDSLIIPLARWREERDAWSACTGRLGIVLLPADKVEQLAADIARFELIAADFPGPSDGRGYTQGRLLRERYGFTGELRAGGYVRRDQLFFLARCGFDSFELPEHELGAADAAFHTFSAEYQPSNDAGLRRKLPRNLTVA